MDLAQSYFATLFGLPVHPLISHLSIVVGAAVSAVVLVRVVRKRKITKRLLWGAGFSLVFAGVGVLSGQAIAERVDFEGALANQHTQQGNWLLLFTALQLVGVILLRWWEGKRRRKNTWLRALIAVVLIGCSAATLAFTALATYTGTKSVWESQLSAAATLER